MTDKEQIIEGVKILATAKSVKKYMRDGCNYSLYCDCKDCDMQNGCTYFNKKQILQKISECEVNND